MFDWLRRAFKPVEPGTLRRLVLRKTSPPTPSPEDFVSPLREELKTHLATKPDIGYNMHCPHCRGHKTIDGYITTAVAEKEDPQPWLKEVHQELVDTQDELKKTRTELALSKQYYTPQNRMKWAAYGAFASGLTGVALILARYGTEWAIHNLPPLLPFLVHLFGL